jgi:hypothetical protein
MLILLAVEGDTPCTSFFYCWQWKVTHPAHCTSILRALEMIILCTPILLAVEGDTPCTSILMLVERDTLCMPILLAAEMDTPCMSTAGCGKGYTLHVHFAGCGNGYALYVSTTGSVKSCIWCSHKLGKLKTEGSTALSLAHYFKPFGGFLSMSSADFCTYKVAP